MSTRTRARPSRRDSQPSRSRVPTNVHNIASSLGAGPGLSFGDPQRNVNLVTLPTSAVNQAPRSLVLPKNVLAKGVQSEGIDPGMETAGRVLAVLEARSRIATLCDIPYI